MPFAPDEAIDELGEAALEDDDDDDGREDLKALLPKKIPVGLKLHVLDIWIDEAEKVGLLDADDGGRPRQVLRRINALVEALEKETTASAVRVRSRQALDDDRLPWNANQSRSSNNNKGSAAGSAMQTTRRAGVASTTDTAGGWFSGALAPSHMHTPVVEFQL